MENIINWNSLEASAKKFWDVRPFPFAVVDDFFDSQHAKLIENSFPDYSSSVWHEYNSPIEVKKVLNNWNIFDSVLYKTFDYLNSEKFISRISGLLGISGLSPDPGLNGGGLHIHGEGGKLNPHLDYSTHPKAPDGNHVRLQCTVINQCALRLSAKPVSTERLFGVYSTI